MNLYFSGRLVASLKEAVCKGTLWGMRREAKQAGLDLLVQGRPASRAAGVRAKVVTKR